MLQRSCAKSQRLVVRLVVFLRASSARASMGRQVAAPLADEHRTEQQGPKCPRGRSGQVLQFRAEVDRWSVLRSGSLIDQPPDETVVGKRKRGRGQIWRPVRTFLASPFGA